MDVAFSIKQEEQSACNPQLFYAILTYLERILDGKFHHAHSFVGRFDIDSQVALEVSDAAVEIASPQLLMLREEHKVDS